MKRQIQQTLSKTIKEAIDSYHGGICFSELNGKPILVNNTMNKLVYQLTGHTVINAIETWKELAFLNNAELYELKQELEDGIVIKLENGNVWQFRRQIIKTEQNDAVQFEASNITKIYQLSIELKENNTKLKNMLKRQQEMLETIVRTNKEKELLSAKMRIHDDFGRCLVATKKAIGNKKISKEEYRRIIDSWSDAVHGLRDINVIRENSTEEELNKVADLIGCKLMYIGEKPKNQQVLLHIYSAIREALTNAVRHGAATEMIIEYIHSEKELVVLISNNGKLPSCNVSEGGGLANLRKSLENSGALLEYNYDEKFALKITFPLIL